MSFRFRRSVRLAPGIRMNLSKSGPSISLGPRGAKVTLGPRGVRRTIGLPGTGLHWTENQSFRKKRKSRQEYDPGFSSERVSISSAEELETLIQSGAVLINPETGRKFTSAQLGKKLREFRQEERRREGQEAIDAEQNALKELIEIANRLPPLQDVAHWQDELMTKEFVPPEFDRAPIPSVDFFVRETRESGSPKRFLAIPFVLLIAAGVAALIALNNTPDQQTQILTLSALGGGLGFFGSFFFILKIYKGWKNKTEIEARKRHQEEAANYEVALKEHSEMVEEERREWHQNEEARISLVKALLEGQVETMEDVIDGILQETEFPFDTSASFQVLNSKHVALDVDLPEIEDIIPTDEPALLKSGEVRRKNRTKSQINADYAKTVTGLAYYFAYEVFESCPSVQKVLVSGYTQRLSKKTGNIEDQYVYSVNMEKSRYSALNLSQIDPLEGFGNFQHNIDTSKTSELKTITPFPVHELSEN